MVATTVTAVGWISKTLGPIKWIIRMVKVGRRETMVKLREKQSLIKGNGGG